MVQGKSILDVILCMWREVKDMTPYFSHELEQELLQPDLRVEDDNLGAGGGGAGEGQHQLTLGIGEKLWCQDFLSHVLLRSWGGVG